MCGRFCARCRKQSRHEPGLQDWLTYAITVEGQGPCNLPQSWEEGRGQRSLPGRKRSWSWAPGLDADFSKCWTVIVITAVTLAACLCQVKYCAGRFSNTMLSMKEVLFVVPGTDKGTDLQEVSLLGLWFQRGSAELGIELGRRSPQSAPGAVPLISAECREHDLANKH